MDENLFVKLVGDIEASDKLTNVGSGDFSPSRATWNKETSKWEEPILN